MAPRSKVVRGKNVSPSGVWLRQRHVPVPQIRLSPDSDQLLGSSSDDGHDDDDDDDDDAKTHTSRRPFHSKRGGCKYSSSFDGSTVGDATFGGNNKGDGHSGDEYNDGNDDMTMVPTVPFPHPLQVVTSPLLLPILSNQVVTKMLSVAETTLMSCCCHALTTLCNNVFLLQTPPHLLAPVKIRIVTPTRKLTVTRLVMIHQILEPIVPVPTKVQWLMPATPVSPFPIRLNQVPGCLSSLVTFRFQKVGQ